MFKVMQLGCNWVVDLDQCVRCPTVQYSTVQYSIVTLQQEGVQSEDGQYRGPKHVVVHS